VAKIKKDKNSRLYVRTNGSVYRPEENKEHDNPLRDKTTIFKFGDEIMLSHIPFSPYAKLKTKTVTETWVTHGCYIMSLPIGQTVEDCWRN